VPSESIGNCGRAQYPDRDWITAELELGICFIRHACGEPPDGYELEVIWNNHDLGGYATIGITWDSPGDAPWDYMRRAERALARFDEAVSWSQLEPEPKEEADDEDSDDEEELEEEESHQDDSEEDLPQSSAGSQQATLFPEPAQPGNVELYRRDGMIEAAQDEWHMAVLIFREMGWKPSRDLEAYIHPLTSIPQYDADAMQRAGRSLFALLEKEPAVSASVQMDLGLFYELTEFVGNGAFIVARPGAYAKAMAEDFESEH
jgi:hypothetical protein